MAEDSFDTGSTEPERITDSGATQGERLGTRSAQLAGQKFGRFRLIRELGHGGQGFVWLAEDSSLKRKVALKLLTYHAAFSEKGRLRFLREAEVASRLDHPGICGVHDVGETDGVPWIAMQYVEGEPLDRMIARNRMTAIEAVMPSHIDFDQPDQEAHDSEEQSSGSGPGRVELQEVLDMIESAARALHVAHEAGLVHRDIKPGNIMVTPDRRAVILDFGLAFDEDAADFTLTQSGEILGTPAYMSPEQVTGRKGAVDRRSDVYSLGVTMYECLCLKRPFEASSRQTLQRKILNEMPQDLRQRNPAVSRDMAVVVAAALQKNLDRRYQTALDLAEDLRRIRESEPIQARPPGPLLRLSLWAHRNPSVAVAMIIVTLVTAVAFLLVLQSRDEERQAKNDALALAGANRRLAEEESRARLQAEFDAESARQTHEFLVGLFQESDPIAIGGRTFGLRGSKEEAPTARDILDRGAAQLGTALAERPAARAYLQDAIGNVYLSLGLLDEAQPLLDESLRVRRELYSEDHIDIARSLTSQAILGSLKGRPCADDFRAVLDAQAATLGEDHPLIRRCRTMGALQLVVENRIDEAEKALPSALEAARANSGEFSHDVALIRLVWAQMKFLQERDAEGIGMLKKAAEALDQVRGGSEFSDLLLKLLRAQLLARSKQYAMADRLYRDCIEKGADLFGPDHFFSALVLTVYGEFLSRDMEAAERGAEILAQAIETKLKLYGPDSHLLATSFIELARCKRALGLRDETIALTVEAERIARLNDRVGRKQLATALHIRAFEFLQLGRFEESVNLLLEVISIQKRASDDDNRTILAMRNLERSLLLQINRSDLVEALDKDPDDAELCLARARAHLIAATEIQKRESCSDGPFIAKYFEETAMEQLQEAIALKADVESLRDDEQFRSLRNRDDFPKALR